MKDYTVTKITVFMMVLGILSGCTSRSGPPASVHYDKPVTPYHIVKKGDSIASIAQRYGMGKRELIRVNGLESPYRIVKGQRLLVRPHQVSVDQSDGDNLEAPATEETGSVPENEEVQVQPLSGEGLEKRSVVESESRLNQETDDEADSEEDSNSSDPRQYDEDKLDEAEKQTKHQQSKTQPFTPPSLPTPGPSGSFTWPAQGTVIRSYNPSGKGKNQNDGINIAAAKGSPVVAANNGMVAHAGNQLRGFGNVVLVKHDNGTMTVYAHLDKVTVKKGDVVNAGQKLGTIGQTGAVRESQLHFEIRKGRKPIDPSKYLN